MSQAPERIYGWLNTQLSIARYYGGCSYQGCSYVIDLQDPEKPLVREDVFQADRKQRKLKDKQARASAQQRCQQQSDQQGSLPL